MVPTLCLIVPKYIAQFFLQLAFCQDVLDTAPSRLAALAGSRSFRDCSLGAFNERIEVVRFFGFLEKLIVYIEMCSSSRSPIFLKKSPLKSIGSISSEFIGAAHYIRFCPAFN